MKTTEFIERIIRQFGFSPTPDQMVALQTFARFLADREPNAVMILRGSAGTGKTSLAAAMVRTMHSLGQKLMLMAPTGRAAKVFSQSSGLQAYTIHRTIYREKSHTGTGSSFSINFNKQRNTLFVADEASMINNNATYDSSFGSGSLLDDLMQFVYGGEGCRLLLIGDKSQLPPVGEHEAPALSSSVLASYNMRVYQCDLNEVLRQDSASGILHNATIIRNKLEESTSYLTKIETGKAQAILPKIRLGSFTDIVVMPGNEIVESISSSYSQVGEDETLVITRSNKHANIFNQGIRNSILDREDALCGGDMLMVVKNKYENPTSTFNGTSNRKEVSFIANGDRCIVRRIRRFEELYGFHFAEVTLQFPDLDDYELETTIIMDTLTSEAPSLTHDQSETLYNNVLEDYLDIPLKTDRLKALRQDKYYNALQVKFAYAVTCHKAQGGQWKHVYVDQGYMTDDMLTPEYFHWLYTAFTRATEKLFLVNWPKNQIEET